MNDPDSFAILYDEWLGCAECENDAIERQIRHREAIATPFENAVAINTKSSKLITNSFLEGGKHGKPGP